MGEREDLTFPLLEVVGGEEGELLEDKKQSKKEIERCIGPQDPPLGILKWTHCLVFFFVLVLE